MTTITMNAEKNGIEIRFDSKPSTEILSGLKENGFRWSGKQKMWYAKQSEAALAFVNEYFKKEANENPCGGTVSVAYKNSNENKDNVEYDLWAMTRTDNIPDNYSLYRIHDCKEIAAIIRKHLRSRFPFCKWSVTSDLHSIDVTLKCSPWSFDSDEAQAIANYAYRFASSYNYDNSDSMTDYFDVNFYGVYGVSSILDKYYYEQREMTVSEMNMSARFAESKAAWETVEEERQQREYEERARQREIEHQESERIRAEQEAQVAKIEAGAVVSDADFFVMDCLEPNIRKLNRISDYADAEMTRIKCRVSRTIHMSKENYDLFAGLLMHDFSFVAGKGGTHTDDFRINSDADYQHMTKAERETVEWYSVDCVAIYCENELKIIVDPQGYSYCRYVFFVDEESKIVSTYTGNTGISEEEAKKYSELADDLEDVSASIIGENSLSGSWDNADFPLYQASMIEWVEHNKFPFTVNVVRAIKNNEAFKVAMYRVLAKYNSLQSQFERAMMVYDQKFTMIKISDFGGVSTTHGKFRSATNTKWAQYDDAVKLIARPENKRQDHYVYLHGNVLIYDGYITVPEDLLFEINNENVGGYNVTTKKSRYGSCDERQLDDILNYFAAQGITPIINTYKPEF